MESILIFIKHHFNCLWKLIEWGNGLLFSLVYKSKLEKLLPEVFKEFSLPPTLYRRLDLSDAGSLFDLIHGQEISDLDYFHPHRLNIESLREQFNKRAFLMMGAFDADKIVGYFFLRFFTNKKCFVGRLIDKEYRGKGIGNVMNNILYEIAWRMNFSCLSTISKNNIAVIRAHAKNSSMIVIKELRNNYLLVKFIRDAQNSGPRALS